MPGSRYIAVLKMIAFAGAVALNPMANAQTRSVRDTSTAYGARLNARGEPAHLNPNRINNRVNSRLETRLSLRVERYRPSSVPDPAAAFAARPTDNARIGTDTTLSPLSSSAASSASQAYAGRRRKPRRIEATTTRSPADARRWIVAARAVPSHRSIT